MDRLNKFVRDEKGVSLIEILAAIVILSIALLGLSSLMYQNFSAIDQNNLIERSIYVRDDIREWMNYRAQSQDIGNLNTFVLINPKRGEETLTIEQQMRRKHLIVSESGIQIDSDTKKTIYGEIARDDTIDRGKLVEKVKYDLSGAILPENLKDDEFNKYYIGEYINDPDFLVKIVVENKSNEESYDPRKDGVRLSIQILSRNTGALLTEGYMNWVAEY
ncbi:prepilin-type N-terminal cleavage/methylation domain-containing protein [Enterococcus faecalis]|uniref:type IV pilus modification PilV family protein n=1 Tax=Enterococcus faecalis TaxID=1351 RepID=UPI001A02765E|nr:prepilin-type N-terminal cleavage/methylation domain-containing protein [Enterococcus faecalis]EGO6705171.1 prepilin-type N-terminal cleavage/methylation domain-containing protein [Enterococcus faecalis]